MYVVTCTRIMTPVTVGDMMIIREQNDGVCSPYADWSVYDDQLPAPF